MKQLLSCLKSENVSIWNILCPLYEYDGVYNIFCSKYHPTAYVLTVVIWNSLYKKYSTFKRSVSFRHSVSYVQPKYWSSKSTGGCSRLLDGSVHSFATLFLLLSWFASRKHAVFFSSKKQLLVTSRASSLVQPLPRLWSPRYSPMMRKAAKGGERRKGDGRKGENRSVKGSH